MVDAEKERKPDINTESPRIIPLPTWVRQMRDYLQHIKGNGIPHDVWEARAVSAVIAGGGLIIGGALLGSLPIAVVGAGLEIGAQGIAFFIPQSEAEKNFRAKEGDDYWG